MNIKHVFSGRAIKTAAADNAHHISSANKIKFLSFPYIIWMAGFIIVPLIMIFYYGLTAKDGHFTFSNIMEIADPDNLKALALALYLSVVSTLICLILAYPLAMILKSSKMGSNSFIVMIIILPMWMNFLLRTIAWQNILEKTGIINKLLGFLNLPTLDIINTPSAIVIGMVYNFLPFMVLPIYNILIKIDKDIVDAARDLGAGSLQTFFGIIFPLSIPGIISGVTMVFVPSLTTFVISTILGGSKINLIGNLIEKEFRGGFYHTGSGLSLVLMIFVLLSMTVISKYNKEGDNNLW